MTTGSVNIHVDFRSLFESAPGSFVVLTPALEIVAATDVYLTATKMRREDLVGRKFFDVFVANPDDPEAGGVVERLRASFERVLRHQSLEALPVHRYDLRSASAEGWEERYWRRVSVPVLGPSGQILYITHATEDVTEIVRLGRVDPTRQEVPGADRSVRLEDFTRQHVAEVFRAHGENLTRSARALGISRVSLRRRLRACGLVPERRG